MKNVFLSIAVLASTTGMTAAADLMMDPAPVLVDEAVFNWSGFYAGIQGGLSTGTVRIDDGFCVQFDDCGFPGNRYYSEPGLSGWALGGHIGAAHQYDSIVLGVETDLNWSDISGEAGYTFYDAQTGDTGDGNPVEMASFALNWEGSARAKIGFAVDRFLPYVTAGIAYGQADVNTHREFSNPDRELDFEHSLNLLGYTVGVGGAYAMTDNLIVHAEARYTEYGELYAHDDLINDGETIVVNGPQLFSVQAGMSFKF